MNAHIDTTVLASAAFSFTQEAQTSGTPSGAPPSQADAGTPSAASSPPDAQESLQRINADLAPTNRVIELRVDAQSHTTVATIIDSNTGKVLQQYPSEDSLHLAQMLASWSHGSKGLLDTKA